MRPFYLVIFLSTTFNFYGQSNIYTMDLSKNEWDIINDDVMGGVSTGKFVFNDSCLTFFGKLSSKFNGGFSSVRTKERISLDGHTKISLKIIGDGNTYQLRIKDSYYNYYSYALEFQTKGIEEQLEFDLSDFKPIFRGTYLEMKNFDKNKIDELTFMIVSKNEPNFKLQIFDIYFN